MAENALATELFERVIRAERACLSAKHDALALLCFDNLPEAACAKLATLAAALESAVSALESNKLRVSFTVDGAISHGRLDNDGCVPIVNQDCMHASVEEQAALRGLPHGCKGRVTITFEEE